MTHSRRRPTAVLRRLATTARRRRLPLLPLLLAACGGRLDVPRPAAADPTPLPPLEAATIVLPVRIALATLQTEIARSFPASDSLDRASCASLGGIVCHQYVYRRDTLALAMAGDRVSLLARLRYRARIAIPGVGGIGSCGYAPQPRRRAELRMATTVYWRNDWTLATRATALDAALVDPCEVTVLRVNAAPVMQRLLDAQLARVRQQVDSTVPAVLNLRASADSIWRAAQQPQPLDSTGSAWLVMAPEAVSVTPLAGVGAAVTTAVVLTARPRVILGARPTGEIRPLPALTLARPASGVHVPVEISLPFTEVAARASAILAGETAGSGLTVRGVQLWSAGDTTVVQVDLAGSMTGSLYLVGRFAYDSATRTLASNDLRYTLASGSAMSRVKATLGAFLVRRAVEQATNGGRFALGAQLDDVRARLTREINRPLGNGATLAGSVGDVRVLGLHTTPTGFVLRVVLDGDARLAVE